MSEPLPLVAVDSCIVVDLLTGNDLGHQERARKFFAKHGTVHRVVLPALVIAEIAGTGGTGGDQGGKEERDRRLELVHQWISDSAYMVAELTERIARQAARLASDHRLKGGDASILATAAAWSCATLCTRDGGLLKVADAIPGLRVCEPGAT